MRIQERDVVVAEILHATIRVMNATGRRLSRGNRLSQRRERQLGIDVFGDRPADDAAREQIEDHRQIHEAVADADVGQIRRPGLVDPREAASRQPVRVHPVRMVRVGGVDEGALDLGVQRKLLHDPANAPLAHRSFPGGADSIARCGSRPWESQLVPLQWHRAGWHPRARAIPASGRAGSSTSRGRVRSFGTPS